MTAPKRVSPDVCQWAPCGQPISPERRAYRALYCARECAVKAAHKRADDRHDAANPDRPRRETWRGRMVADRGPVSACEVCAAEGDWRQATTWLLRRVDEGPSVPDNTLVLCPRCGRLEYLRRLAEEWAKDGCPLGARIADTANGWLMELWTARGAAAGLSAKTVSPGLSPGDTPPASAPSTVEVSDAVEISDTTGDSQ